MSSFKAPTLHLKTAAEHNKSDGNTAKIYLFVKFLTGRSCNLIKNSLSRIPPAAQGNNLVHFVRAVTSAPMFWISIMIAAVFERGAVADVIFKGLGFVNADNR